MKPSQKKSSPPKKSAHQHINTSKNPFYILAAIIAFAAIVHSTSINNDFTNYDDDKNITENIDITGLSANNIKTFFTKDYMGVYVPVTMLSYAVDYKLWGMDAHKFHLTSLIIHLLNVCLVFYLILLILNLQSRNFGIEGLTVATVTALLFSIHPINVEGIAWLTSRSSLLYSFFYLSALIFYIKSTPPLTLPRKGGELVRRDLSEISSPSDNKSPVDFVPSGGVFYFLSILFFLLSVLSKNAAVIFPVTIILIDFYCLTPQSPLQKRGEEKRWLSNFLPFGEVRWGWYLPFFIVSIIAGILTLNIRKDAGVTDLPFEYSLIDRFFLITNSLVAYLVKSIVPYSLSALYPYPSKPENLLPMLFYVSPVALFLIGYGVYKLNKIPLTPLNKGELVSQTLPLLQRVAGGLIFGLLFFLINIFLSIVPLLEDGFNANRYAYIPFIGLYFAISLMFNVQSLKFKNIAVAALVGYTLILSFITFNRNKTWKTTETLWNDVIEQDKNAAFAYYGRGNFRSKSGNYIGAVEDYNNALKLNPKYIPIYYFRGMAKASNQDYKGAVEDYTQAIKFHPEFADAYSNRGQIKMDVLRDFDGAMNDFNKAISISPNFHLAYNNRGALYGNLGKFQEAINDFTKAIEHHPNFSDAYKNRGNALQLMGNKKDACADFQKAIQLGNPQAAELAKVHCK